MLSRALVVFQSANRWHCESHGFSCLFYLLFFLCVCVSSYFVFSLLCLRPLPPVLPLAATYKYAKRSRGGGRVFHEVFRRCFERPRGKKSSEETRFAQARGWARFTLALAKIV